TSAEPELTELQELVPAGPGRTRREPANAPHLAPCTELQSRKTTGPQPWPQLPARKLATHTGCNLCANFIWAVGCKGLVLCARDRAHERRWEPSL
uniref:Uncharacterized protein n=1 Tax=Oryctolagus cuniculus TaxID=9986 RepID=A0A5F9C2K2_RABIT